MIINEYIEVLTRCITVQCRSLF